MCNLNNCVNIFFLSDHKTFFSKNKKEEFIVMSDISHKFEFRPTSSHVSCETSKNSGGKCYIENSGGTKVCGKKSVCNKLDLTQMYYVVVEATNRNSFKYEGFVSYQGKF